jgi:hypothetical protein
MIAHETIGGGIEVEFSFQPVRDAAQQAESVERYVSFVLGSEDIPLARCRRQKQKSSLSDLLRQPIFIMQAAKHGRLHNAVTGGQLVSVIAGRNAVLAGLRNSRT